MSENSGELRPISDWPTHAWKATDPIDQKVSEDRLHLAEREIERAALDVYSFLVIRKGAIIFERYFQGYSATSLMEIRSVTKSFLSTLIGIALMKKMLISLDQPVLSYFPEIVVPDQDQRKGEITIRDLLTMRSGFNWDEARDYDVYSSDHPVQWMFNLPLKAPPGQMFHYNSGATQILSHLIFRLSGKTPLEFARQELFAPLGIRTFEWLEDAQGVSLGFAGLVLTARDLAKLGLLYLKQGVWEGQDLLSAQYIQEATTAWSEGGDPEGIPYGYLWWVTPGQRNRSYLAAGYGGQYLWVSPAFDLITVLTAEYRLPPGRIKDINYLITDFVIPAVIE